MKFAYGSSKKGDVSEALRTITEPAALFFSVAKEDMLERVASEIEKTFPGVASIGGVGQAYIDRQFFDAGITVIAMKENIKVVADVLEQASVMPIKYIRRLENAVRAVGGERGNTACFDICSAGADVRAVTTLSDYLCRLGYDTSELGIGRDKITTQTFKNPFGHVCNNDTYIVSIKGVESDGSITTFRPANRMDFLTILSMGDYREVVQDTIARIKSDLGGASAVLSVNCLFRYIMFNDENYWDSYLSEMCRSFSHAGMVGVGEHYNTQFVNQTMCCLAFE